MIYFDLVKLRDRVSQISSNLDTFLVSLRDSKCRFSPTVRKVFGIICKKERITALFCICCGTGIRTPINASRGRCPTIRRSRKDRRILPPSGGYLPTARAYEARMAPRPAMTASRAKSPPTNGTKCRRKYTVKPRPKTA